MSKVDDSKEMYEMHPTHYYFFYTTKHSSWIIIKDRIASGIKK